MSRLATLPNALTIELVERVRGEDATIKEVGSPLEGGAFVDVGRAQAVYARGTDTIVEMNSWRYYRFGMPSETAACEGVKLLAQLAGGR